MFLHITDSDIASVVCARTFSPFMFYCPKSECSADPKV